MMKKALLALCALTVLSGCCNKKWNRKDHSHAMMHQQMMGETVWFDLNSAMLNKKAMMTLEKQVAWLKENPTYMAKIEGHADERGTREYNLALGEKRAKTVKCFLVKHGIAEDRISTVSYGKEKPAVLGHNEEAWAKNRRGEVVLWVK